MQVEPLKGLQVNTPAGDRTILVTGTSEGRIDFSFVEDRDVTYSIKVAKEYLVSHPDRIRGLVADWLRDGPEPGAILLLSAFDVIGRRPPD